MAFGIIYKATSPSGKVYIGQTLVALSARISEHTRKAFNPNSLVFDTKLSRAIRKYGELLQWTVIEVCPLELLSEKESFYISQYMSFKNGYNMTLGGDGTRGIDHSKENNPFYGKKHSEQTKIKLCENHKGQIPWNKGLTKNDPRVAKNIELSTKTIREQFSSGKRKISEETKQKISKSVMGEKNPFYGKTHSKEAKRKMSEAQRKK